jgi:hypothetical protein
MAPRAGLGHQQRQQGRRLEDRLGLPPEGPREGPDGLGVLVEDLDNVVAQPDGEVPAAEGGPCGVGITVNEQVPGFVGLARLVAHRVEPDPGQGQRRSPVLDEQLAQGQALAIVRGRSQRIAPTQQNVVEPGQGGGLRFGDHEVAAQETDRVFHVAFLMSRVRVAVARLGAVVQLERAEQLRLHDLGSDPASNAGGVVKDHVPGCGHDVLEHPAQSMADAFGGLAPVRLHERMFENGKVTTRMCKTCRMPAMMASA